MNIFNNKTFRRFGKGMAVLNILAITFYLILGLGIVSVEASQTPIIIADSASNVMLNGGITPSDGSSLNNKAYVPPQGATNSNANNSTMINGGVPSNSNIMLSGGVVDPSAISNGNNNSSLTSYWSGVGANWNTPAGSQTPGVSPVLVPTPSTALLTQTGVVGSADCGIAVNNDKFQYCMLAPVNGLFGTPATSAAGKKTEMVNLSGGIKPFFATIYKVGIAIAIGLAIVMITFGGIRWATTDSFGGSDDGRKMINAAVAGLLLALFSYVLLNTINPALISGNGVGDIFPANKPVFTPNPTTTINPVTPSTPAK